MGLMAFLILLLAFCCESKRLEINVHLIPHSHVDPMWKFSPDEYSKETNRILEGAVLSLIQNPNRTFIWESVFFLDLFLTSFGSSNICDHFSQHQLDREVAKTWCGSRHGLALAAARGAGGLNRCCSMKEAISKVVSSGQLELVGGGWVSHDETLTDFESKLDNYAAGRRWIAHELGIK
jgi:alpha-mannosidase II